MHSKWDRHYRALRDQGLMPEEPEVERQRFIVQQREMTDEEIESFEYSEAQLETIARVLSLNGWRVFKPSASAKRKRNRDR